MNTVTDALAQSLWQAYVINVGVALPNGVADMMARLVVEDLGLTPVAIGKALQGHTWWFVGNLGVPGMADRRGYACTCGWSTGDPDSPDFEDPHEHVAKAMLDVLFTREGQ